MLLGLRVVRGPDWNLGNLDGEEGGVGTIVSVEIGQNGRPLPEKSVLVYWDSGSAVICRVGSGECYDLRVYDSASSGVLHSQFTCDECDQSGIAGMRWHCCECYDYDLCSDCYMTDKHHKDHNFLRFDKPNNRTDGCFHEDRLNATKVRARGIFPGATVRRGPHLTLDSDDLGSSVGQVVEFTAWEEKARSAVIIQWSDGLETTYRVGYEGKVDLELVECADGPLYYKDHLPVVEYQSADIQEFRVGDQVRVNRYNETVKKMTQENSGCAANENQHPLCQVGRIFKIDDDDNVHVAYGPVLILHRSVIQKVPELQVQDDFNNISQYVEMLLMNEFQGDVEHEIQKVLDNVEEGPAIREIDENIDALLNVESFLKNEEVFEKNHLEMTEIEMKKQLFLASSAGDLERIRYILTLDEGLVNEKSEKGIALLHVACEYGNADVVTCLIENGADVEIKDENGFTPLHHAASGDKTGECVVLMLTANAIVNIVSAKTKLTPLHLAVDAQNLPAVSALMNSGQCDVNYQNVAGNTPLHCAVFSEEPSILAEILKASIVEPCICNINGLNALQLACELNNKPATRALLNKFPKLMDVRNQDGFTPLHLAVLGKHCQIAKLLINEGRCSIDLPDNNGVTALAFAVSLSHKDMIEILMECGANVNAVDNSGDTPLHVALMKYYASQKEPDPGFIGRSKIKLQVAIIRSLVLRGADNSSKNNQGDTPLDVCVYDGFANTLKELLKYPSASMVAKAPRCDSLEEGVKEEVLKHSCDVALTTFSKDYTKPSNRSKDDRSNSEAFQSVLTGCDDTNIPAHDDRSA